MLNTRRPITDTIRIVISATLLILASTANAHITYQGGNTQGATTALTTDTNNRQLHIKEIDLIKARAKDFAKRLNGNQAATPEQIAQAEARLLDQGDRNVNQHSDLRFDAEANRYLTDLKRELAMARQDTLPDNGQYFFASPEQYFNDSLYADTLSSPTGQQAYRHIQASQTGLYLPGYYYKQGIEDANKEAQRQAIAGAIGATVVLAPMAISACLTNPLACNQVGITAAEILAEGGVVAGGVVVGKAAVNANKAKAGVTAGRVAGEAKVVVVDRSAGFFDDLAAQSTRNPDSTRVVLGKYLEDDKSYTKVASHYEASYLKIENYRELSKTLGPEEMWRVNESFLDQQIRTGKEIILSHDPVKATGFYQREIGYLNELGYKFVQDGWVWRAVR